MYPIKFYSCGDNGCIGLAFCAELSCSLISVMYFNECMNLHYSLLFMLSSTMTTKLLQ